MQTGLQPHTLHETDESTPRVVERAGAAGYEVAVEASSAIRFELDLGWAGTGGADPAALLGRMTDRVSLVHVKDMDFERGEFVTVGEGDLDLEAAVRAARDADVEWAIFENDQPVDPRAEIGHASVLLHRHVGHLCR
jgi:sugar phosphate isomerase/epimerase